MDFIVKGTLEAVKALYNAELKESDISLQETRKEFEGEVTVVTFPLTRLSKKSPEQTGSEIGEYLVSNLEEVSKFNVIKGFLNISITDTFLLKTFNADIANASFGSIPSNGKKVMVEYSSPNTNKPLHLGHVRNNLLGYSVSEILAAAGYDVIKANLVNDRGIHICKSMLAWQKFGNGETPQSSGLKGDKLVGNYYVIFDKEHKKQTDIIIKEIAGSDYNSLNSVDVNAVREIESQIELLKNKISNELSINFSEDGERYGNRFEIILDSVSDGNHELISLVKVFDSEDYSYLSDKERKGYKKEVEGKLTTTLDLEKKSKDLADKIKEIAKKNAPLMKEAQQMLQKWEAGDAEVINLWKTMNSWVYEGFDVTYKKLGVSFDKFYYESDTYLLGKDIIEEGLEKGVFYKKEDNSVWIDLTADGLDEKLVLRGDGTSVYITQDLGTAELKYKDFNVSESIYVVGNEQDYHFKVLFLILDKLGKSWAKGLYHLSYGMVDLPSGKMKSREGTVVDADDLIQEMNDTAKQRTEELGKTEDFSDTEKEKLYNIIGLGALKYFLLKVEPKKRLLFDPNESIDFQGHTGPFIQYTHARIRSVLAKSGLSDFSFTGIETFTATERELILALNKFPEVILAAAKEFSPALIANYVYELAKLYNKFYHEEPILKVEDDELKKFRLALSASTAAVIKKAMKLLGIEVPEKM